jgi:serine/threonine-protein kinase
MELLGAKLDGGRYEVMQRIATGAMGVVYRGRQAPLGREVAIKLLRESRMRCQHSISAFWREARAASMIDHPNVVRVIDFGLDRDLQYFIVMELLEGHSLEDVLGHDPLPPVRWSCEVVAQLLSALAAAHDAGVVHQDVKPGNVKLHRAYDSNGLEVEVAKLCDFGLAALLRATVVEDDDDAAVTSDELWGTPEYMSPEQARGERPTPSTDVYACGVILYQMTTGRLPFEHGTPAAIAQQHIECEPTPPSRIRPDLAPALEAVIMRALQKRAADRFPDARAMRAALLAAISPARRAGDRERVASERGDEATAPYPMQPEPLLPFDESSSVRRVTPIAQAAVVLARAQSQEALPELDALRRPLLPLWALGTAAASAGLALFWLLHHLH